MIYTLSQDKILRKYSTQINEDQFKITSNNIPKLDRQILLDLDASNMVLYEKHLIVNIDILK